ncbi:CBS domain-containing protein [Hyphococcus sp.]|uniref:CBS domain-containing protein n=1 Tax=Hyphococcus sp. TaxID=2038636 RepID=UPI003CCBDE9D
MKISEVMSKDCKYCGPDDAVTQAAQLMASEDFGAVPIAKNDHLVGMLTDRDIVIRGVAKGRDVTRVKAGELMSDNMYYCYDDEDTKAVADNMGELQVRRLPVVNRDKRLVGIVSLGDLSTEAKQRHAGEALREISEPAH